MKTLLVCPELFDTEGGISRILRLYLKALCEDAWETGGSVDLAVLNDRSFPPAALARYSTRALRRAVPCGRGRARLALQVLRLCRAGDGPVLCGHVGQLGLVRLLARKRPVVCVAHGIEVWRPFGPLERAALRGTRRILCVSDCTRREIMARCPGLNPGRLVILPNALDPHFPIRACEPGARRPPGSVLLAVSRLSAADSYKGVDRLIEALPEIRRRRPGATLRIAGTGDDRPRLEALARTLGVGEAVEFLGFVPEERLPAAFDACDLFALPSTREGFGLVYLEAMARGRPVLGLRAGGVPEVIGPGSGVLVEPADAPGLAAACAGALAREWSVDPILDRARRFSYDAFKRRLLVLMREID